MSEEVFCKVCGESNKLGSNFCSSCGASLSQKTKNNKSLNGATPKKQSAAQRDSSDRKAASKNRNTELKIAALPSKKLIILVSVLFLVGAVILIASGIFDNPVPSSENSQTSSQNNPHAGVDLNSLNKITELEKTVKANPKDSESLLQLAHLLNDSGFKDKAIERYQAYLKIEPKNADVWVDMGVCYYDQGNNQEAISAMERALKLQPKHQIANLDLGIVNSAMGNKTKALAYWQKAADIDPTNEIGKKAKELLNSQ